MRGGLSYKSQCTKRPDGASGSSTINARPLVALGTSVHASGGEMFPPRLEYLSGMTPSFWKPRLVSLKLILPPLSRRPSPGALLHRGPVHQLVEIAPVAAEGCVLHHKGQIVLLEFFKPLVPGNLLQLLLAAVAWTS